jgi:DNA-binding XRE family transcriptional regulator
MGRKTGDALEMLDRRHAGDTEWEIGVLEEELKARVAQVVYAIREEMGMTQTQLAKIVGTHQTNISKLENADYNGSALEMLWRICVAVHKPFQITYPCPGQSEPCQVAISTR